MIRGSTIAAALEHVPVVEDMIVDNGSKLPVERHSAGAKSQREETESSARIRQSDVDGLKVFMNIKKRYRCFIAIALIFCGFFVGGGSRVDGQQNKSTPLVKPPLKGKSATENCRPLPEAAAFDFLLGTWKGVEKNPQSGETLSTSELRIRKILSGCVIEEKWRYKVKGKDLFSAILLRSFDAKSRKWFVSYTDDKSNHQFYEGSFELGEWNFYRKKLTDGKETLVRIIWKPVSKVEFSSTLEHSADGGKTWQTVSIETFTRSK